MYRVRNNTTCGLPAEMYSSSQNKPRVPRVPSALAALACHTGLGFECLKLHIPAANLQYISAAAADRGNL